jgi:hypothetical protein
MCDLEPLTGNYFKLVKIALAPGKQLRVSKRHAGTAGATN